MSLAQIHSRALLGLDAPLVTVEVHLANGLPSFTLVGLADVEVREARERVRSAIVNSGLDFPNNKRITVNLAPADLPKDSGRFDLAIAMGILAASGQVELARLEGYEFAGELSLSGALRPVRGALPVALALCQQNAETVSLVFPPQSAQEAALVPNCRVYCAQHLLDVVAFFKPEAASAGQPTSEPVGDTGELGEAGKVASAAPAGTPGWKLLSAADAPVQAPSRPPDMAEVKGQAMARRALEIAAAGQHHVLMVGPPGAGKSMLAQRFGGLLPSMTVQEALESAALASLAGRFAWQQWACRPFRSPHHTASAVALVGGGSPPRPGEISLAHNGVLYLDEMPEFPRAALEALREPLETGLIHIARAAQHAIYPARFQLIAAMNPCPCGYHGSNQRPCRCTPDQVRRYQSKLSGPLLDRIDIHIEVAAMPPHELLHAQPGEASHAIALRAEAARRLALERQGCSNYALEGQTLERNAHLSDDASAFVQSAAQKLQWSARAMHRVVRVSRTIADLAASPNIERAHVAEAIQYRRGLVGAG